MRLVFLLILLTPAILTFSQQEVFKGFIISTDYDIPLHGAHIKNLSQNTLVTSRLNGTFEIPVFSGDTLEITYVGYQTQLLTIDLNALDNRTSISMQLEKVILDDIVVTPFPEYSDFKQMILELDPPDSSLKIKVPAVGRLAFYDPREAPVVFDPTAPSIAIPFNLEGLTKLGKEKKKYRKVLELEKQWKEAHEKFNREWVAEITGLEGQELTSFIAFCDFSAKYIIETHLIELKEEMLALLDEFQSTTANMNENRYTPGA